jgi:hypothetical protein
MSDKFVLAKISGFFLFPQAAFRRGQQRPRVGPRAARLTVNAGGITDVVEFFIHTSRRSVSVAARCVA